MKINNNSSFPYPVLGIRNDIIPGLPKESVEIEELMSDVYNYSYKLTLKFDNHTIAGLIKDGKAKYTCVVDCNKTFYNKCFNSPTNEVEISIPRRNVNGRVYFRPFIVAVSSIDNYDNPNKHRDFDGFTFNIEPGEILAAFPTITMDTDLRSDILHVAGSYMEIRKDDYAKKTVYRLDSQKIGIVLPTELYNIYNSSFGFR